MLNSTIATLHALLRTRAALRRPGVALSASPRKSRRDARAVLIGLVGMAAMTMSTPAHAQVLQDGDLVIAANGLSSQNLYGIFYRLRSGNLTPLFTSGQNGIDHSVAVVGDERTRYLDQTAHAGPLEPPFIQRPHHIQRQVDKATMRGQIPGKPARWC